MADVVHADRRAELEAERARLVAQLRELGADVDAETSELDYDEGFADTAQVTAERAEVEALAGTLRETLTEVDVALAKFDTGTYGKCETCGEEIGDARLEAMPMARECMTCASKKH